MPLDAYARLMVAQVTGRENPRVEIQGKRRKFTASEIYFSWLAEPELWEKVAFLPLENEATRRQMGLPVFDAGGKRLAKLSPAEVEALYASKDYGDFVAQMEAAREKSADKQYPTEYRTVIEALHQLETELTTYRALTFHPATADLAQREDFQRQVFTLLQTWSMQGLGQNLSRIPFPDAASPAMETSVALRTLSGLFMPQKPAGNENAPAIPPRQNVPLVELQAYISQLVASTTALQTNLTKYLDQVRTTGRPASVREDEWRYVQARSLALQNETNQFCRQAEDLFYALYENGPSPGLLPSLDAAALDAQRDESVQAHPGLNRNALLYGSPTGILRHFPKEKQPYFIGLQGAWANMVIAWKKGQTDDFYTASKKFASILRRLAADTEVLS